MDIILVIAASHALGYKVPWDGIPAEHMSMYPPDSWVCDADPLAQAVELLSAENRMALARFIDDGDIRAVELLVGIPRNPGE